MDHPLKVYHPGKGTHYMCQWWTHNEQHQVIIAKTEAGIKKVWRAAHERYNDATIKALHEIELIAPSNLMCEKASASERAVAVESFLEEVTTKLQGVIELGLSLPSQFTTCKGWENADGYNSKPDSTTLKYHFHCKNCINSFSLVGFTPEQFYDKFHEPWSQLHPRLTYTDKRSKAVYSAGRQADDQEHICVVKFAGGHHHLGISVETLEAGEIPPPFTVVLFYFQMIREIDFSIYKSDAQIYHEEQKKLKEFERELARIEYKEKDLKSAKNTLALFS